MKSLLKEFIFPGEMWCDDCNGPKCPECDTGKFLEEVIGGGHIFCQCQRCGFCISLWDCVNWKCPRYWLRKIFGIRMCSGL